MHRLCKSCGARPTPPKPPTGRPPTLCLSCAKKKGQKWQRTLRTIAQRDGFEAAEAAAEAGGVPLPADLRPEGAAPAPAPAPPTDITATGDMKASMARLRVAVDYLSQHAVDQAQRGDLEAVSVGMLAINRAARALDSLRGSQHDHASVRIVFKRYDKETA